jgi:hypothetical protein
LAAQALRLRVIACLRLLAAQLVAQATARRIAGDQA